MTKTKRIIGMVLGILFIGLCVSFLRLSQFGVEPFSAMNLGISGCIGWSLERVYRFICYVANDVDICRFR